MGAALTCESGPDACTASGMMPDAPKIDASAYIPTYGSPEHLQMINKKRKEAKVKTEVEILQDAYSEPEINIEIPIEDVQAQQEIAAAGSIDVEEATAPIAELVSEPFEDAFLHVVPDDYSDEEVTQGTFWDEEKDMQPSEENPLLQRAFRVVNDD